MARSQFLKAKNLHKVSLQLILSMKPINMIGHPVIELSLENHVIEKLLQNNYYLS